MADVDIAPKIRCDNCGETVDKMITTAAKPVQYGKPRAWGSCKMEGGRAADSYGGKVRLDFTDLCLSCANAALDAAADALKVRREGDAL